MGRCKKPTLIYGYLMALSDNQIVKMALSQVSQRTTADFRDDFQNPAAQQIADNFEMYRSYLHTVHRWRFLNKRATLARVSETPVYGYSYTYAMPLDCEYILRVKESTPWTLEGRYIYANSESLTITYTLKVTDSTIYPAYFDNLLAHYIAFKIAPTFAVNQKSDLERQYKLLLLEAKRLDAMQASQDDMQVQGWTDAARGSMSYYTMDWEEPR